MALIFKNYVLAVTLIDREGDETLRRFPMLSTITDYTDAAALAADVLAALANMTYDHVSQYAIEGVYAEDALSLPTDAAAQNFNQILLVYQLDAVGFKTATQSLPAPNQGIFVAASGAQGKVLDTTDAAVVAWRSLFQNDAGLTISDGEQVNTLQKGHRRSTRSASGN